MGSFDSNVTSLMVSEETRYPASFGKNCDLAGQPLLRAIPGLSHRRARRWWALIALAGGVGLAGCASRSPNPPAAGPSATTTTTTTTPLSPMQTANGGEFLSPSGNISCEVNYRRAGLTTAYCQTVTPPRSVTMKPSGTYTTCTGRQCLGNPGIETPTLPYGAVTGVGPYRCKSAPTGVTCTAGGRGFQISKSGVTPVSG